MIETAVDALNGGKIVVLPTDTVYGLCVSPYREEPAQKVFELKGRADQQPIALIAGDLEMLFECVPELRGRSGTIARELLPGPYTLVFPNPAGRYQWLTGDRPDTIGVRVPILEGYGSRCSIASARWPRRARTSTAARIRGRSRRSRRRSWTASPRSSTQGSSPASPRP